MAKVVNRVDNGQAIVKDFLPKAVKCSSCTSDLSVGLGDLTVKSKRVNDFRGEFYATEYSYTYKCPVCGFRQKLELTKDQVNLTIQAQNLDARMAQR